MYTRQCATHVGVIGWFNGTCGHGRVLRTVLLRTQILGAATQAVRICKTVTLFRGRFQAADVIGSSTHTCKWMRARMCVQPATHLCGQFVVFDLWPLFRFVQGYMDMHVQAQLCTHN